MAMPVFKRGEQLFASQLNQMSQAIDVMSRKIAALESGQAVGSIIGEPAVRARVLNTTYGTLYGRDIVKLDLQSYKSSALEVNDRIIDASAVVDPAADVIGVVCYDIPSGQIGEAYIAGISLANATVNDDSHAYAVPVAGEGSLSTVASDTPGALVVLDRDAYSGWVIVQVPRGGGGGGDSRWVSLDVPTVDGSSLTWDTDPGLDSGIPIRWTEDGTTYAYGVILADAYGAYTYRGPAMGTVTAMWYDSYRLSTMVHLFCAGEYANSTDTDILWNLKSVRFDWLGSPSYLVGISAAQGTNATTTQPIVNVSIDDSNVSANGVQMVSSAWEENDATDISSTNYVAIYGDPIKIAVTTAAVGATKAKDLSIELLFVSE